MSKNNEAIFKQNYTLELFVAFKMAYSCSFGFRGNLDFPDFLQKKFYNINNWRWGENKFLRGALGRRKEKKKTTTGVCAILF